MTTSETSGTMAHTSDEDFRAWGAATSAMLASVGLAQTSDTGQIDWATVLRPAANTAAGYEIWSFNDELQSTAPIFFKVEYGTGGATTTPGIWITVGMGSNGAGTITGGGIVARTSVNVNSAPTPGTGNRYACLASGALSVCFHVVSTGNSFFSFAIHRSCDAAGAPTNDGAVVYLASGVQSNQYTLKFAGGGTVSAATLYYCVIPSKMTISATGTDKQVFPHFASFPRIRMLHGIFTFMTADLTNGMPVSIDLGYGARTFMPLYKGIGNTGHVSAMTTASTGIAFLWE